MSQGLKRNTWSYAEAATIWNFAIWKHSNELLASSIARSCKAGQGLIALFKWLLTDTLQDQGDPTRATHLKEKEINLQVFILFKSSKVLYWSLTKLIESSQPKICVSYSFVHLVFLFLWIFCTAFLDWSAIQIWLINPPNLMCQLTQRLRQSTRRSQRKHHQSTCQVVNGGPSSTTHMTNGPHSQNIVLTLTTSQVQPDQKDQTPQSNKAEMPTMIWVQPHSSNHHFQQSKKLEEEEVNQEVQAQKHPLSRPL